MKGAPSIAVMLGKPDGAEDEEKGELPLSEAKARAEDAAKAFAEAVKAGDAKRIYRAFMALDGLCDHIHELEESGEDEDDGYADAEKSESESEEKSGGEEE